MLASPVKATAPPADAVAKHARSTQDPTFVTLPGLIPYEYGLSLQRSAAERVAAGSDGGTVYSLEHEPVFTAGRRATAAEFPQTGTPVVQVNRGGKVTWHGPGQLVVYPIVRLSDGVGGVTLVRALEDALIAVASDFGVRAYRVAGRTGVWTDSAPDPHRRPQAKLAQIGIHVSRHIVTHGISLNCSNDLAPFNTFVPCGISDAGVTTLSEVSGSTITPSDAAPIVARTLAPILKEFTA